MDVGGLERGKLYQFDGEKLVELEPSGDKKLAVTESAFEAVKAARAMVHKALGLRPELAIVTSAMLAVAARHDDEIAGAVRHLYSSIGAS